MGIRLKTDNRPEKIMPFTIMFVTALWRLEAEMGEGALWTKEDERFMKEALKQARKAEAFKEVPIGCVIVYGGKVIGRGYNKRNMQGSALAHAELLAIGKASRRLGDWRLEDCSLYVTLEPCPMCAGAIVQARIPKVFIGAMNPKAGCAGSILNILEERRFNHQVETVRGVLGEECATLMRDFFRKLRDSKKA